MFCKPFEGKTGVLLEVSESRMLAWVTKKK